MGAVAHRTSPTNIGMLLTSTLTAYDLGYLDQFGLSTRLFTTLETLDQLERFRGHFLNWYDTLTLQPLQPRYISTVDSGNLAAGLIVIAQACKTMPDAPVFRWELWQGYLDTLSNLTQTLKEIQNPDFMRKIEEINRKIAAIRLEILSVESYPERWYPLYLKVSGPFWLELSHLLMGLVEISHPAFDQKSLGNLKEITEQVERHHSAVQRTIFELVPWIPFFENAPQPLGEPQFLQTLEELKKSLPYNLALGQIHRQTEAALPHIGVLRRLLKEKSPADRTAGSSPSLTEIGQWQTWQKWVEDLAGTLAHVDASSTALLVRFEQIIARAERYVQEMDFRFLYQPERRVFHIGFNLDAGLLDNNYYDLLASESRIASIIAIAKGEVPQSHWLHLSRPVTAGGRCECFALVERHHV